MFIIVFITAKDKAEAVWIADKLLKEKLAACVNIIEKIESRFWWNGGIDFTGESLLVVKSKKELFGKIETAVKSIHSYECPEIIAMDIAVGSRDYLQWMEDSL